MNKEVRILGILIDEDELRHITEDYSKKSLFLNKQNQYQFMLKAISDTPDEFFDTKIFSAFEPQLSPEIDHLFDRNGYCPPYKIEEWFSKRAVIFSPQKTVSGYCNAEDNIQLVDLPAAHNEETKYVPIPVFDLKNLGLSLEEFEIKLQNSEWINAYPGVSADSEDVFPMLLVIREDKFYVYGNVENKDYDDNGLRVFFENNVVKRAEFDLYDGNKIIIDSKYDVVFMPNELTVKYEKELQVVEYIQIKTETPVVIETSEEKEIAPSVAIKESEHAKRVQVETLNEESEFLQQFFNVVRDEGMLYDESDLINFHVAMKSSNLVILSGMSGTGKSRLVRLYAKAIGLNEKSANRLKVVPVKPSWNDDADLLGYLDTTNMVYRPSDTGIVDVLAEAAKNPNGISIICLDEMNLSRVEHYFSQFLSILEGNESERVIRLYNPNIEHRVYNASDYPAEIKIGKNVIFVGTVNVDESTYHFSDKVLDRADVIKLHNRNFMDLKALVAQERTKTSIQPITMKIFQSFKYNQAEMALILSDDEINLLNELNIIMLDNLPNCAIGYRIVRQIDTYLKNLPETTIYPRSRAFDYLLVQRVFTKLRGSEEQLRKLIGKVGDDGLLADSAIVEILKKYSRVSDFYESIKIITNKAKELVTYGYTI